MADKKPLSETVRQLGALSTVGISFVLAIVLGAWFGKVLDNWLGTSPWLFFLFFFFGLAAGVLNVFRIVSQAYPKRTAGPAAPPAPQAAPPRLPGVDGDADDHELEDDDR